MNASGAVVSIIAIAVAVVVYLLAVRPGVRLSRLEAHPELWRPLVGDLPPLAERAELAAFRDELAQMFALDAASTRADAQIRDLYFPVPEPHADAEATLESVARALADPRIGIAVAGGEQLIHNLCDMALPGALETLGEHAWTGLVAAVKSEVMAQGKSAIVDHLFHAGLAHDFLANALHETVAHGAVGAAAEVVGHAHEAFDPSAATGFHMPWVTAFTSVVRETQLLSRSQTTLSRSIEHVALDTGSTAMGAWAGAKAGAIAGSVVPGLGTALGMLGGAIVGAMAGRSFGERIKSAPLERAVAEYRAAAELATVQVAQSASRVAEVVNERSRTGRRGMAGEIERRPSWRWSPADLELARELCQAMRATIESRLRAIDGAAAERVREVPADAWYHVVLGVAVVDELRTRIGDLHGRQRAEALDALERVNAIERELGDPIASIVALLAICASHDPRVEHALSRILTALKRHRADLIARLQSWMAMAVLHYRQALSEVCATAVEEAARHRGVVAEATDKLAPLREAIARERSALGR